MDGRVSFLKPDLEADHSSTKESQPLVAQAPLKRDALVCVGFAGLAGCLLGFDVGMVAGVLDPIHDYFEIGTRRSELFVGSLNIAAFFGCFLASWLADAYGRRGALSLAAVLFFFGNLLQALAWSYVALIVGRVVAGFAVGFVLILAPLYTAEVSPARFRGTLTTFMEISINLGIVSGYFACWALSEWNPETTWRIIVGFGSVPAFVLAIGTFFFMVESPRWLVVQGRLTEAQAVLDKVMDGEEAQRVMQQLQAALSAHDGCQWKELFTKTEFQYPLALGVAIAFFAQSTGIESVQYYSARILADSTGLDRNSILLANLCMGLVKCLFILVATFLVDRVGRRPLFMVGGLGMAASMLCLASSNPLEPTAFVEVLGLMGFVSFFSIGYGPLVYVFNGEIFPQAARSKGISVAMSVSRLLSSIVSLTFLSFVQLVTYRGAWSTYASMAMLGTLFVFCCVPETKGKSLEAEL